jgi:hypothetical protein
MLHRVCLTTAYDNLAARARKQFERLAYTKAAMGAFPPRHWSSIHGSAAAADRPSISYVPAEIAGVGWESLRWVRLQASPRIVGGGVKRRSIDVVAAILAPEMVLIS